jgi:hypothetical protein
VRWLALLLVLATALLAAGSSAQTSSPSPSAVPLRIHVRGGAVFQASARQEGDGFIIRGELQDDTGSPIADRTFKVRAARGATPVRLPSPLGCDRSRHAGRSGGEESLVETDAHGSFCVLFTTTAAELSLKLRYDGDALHEPADLEVGVDGEHDQTVRTHLRFEPAPEIVDLDRDVVTVTAALKIDREDAARFGADAGRREGQTITIVDERGKTLAHAATGGDGRAKLEIKTTDLDGPGPGELELRFAGATPLRAASTKAKIIRRAEVHLQTTPPTTRVDPDEGFALDVDVQSSRGPVSSGIVEVLAGNESVAAGNVEAGHAHVVVILPSTRDGAPAGTQVTLRFAASTPWWKAGPEVRFVVQLAGPGVAKQLLLAAAVIGVAIWVVYGWRRAPKQAATPGLETAAPPPSGRAGVQVIATTNDASGWRGTVVDAHDGAPIVGASLRIVSPTFQGDGVVARATSDDRGSFTLDAAYRPDARLVVEGAAHATHEQSLPPPSLVLIALVTRRRALLERLVRWARRNGPPYDAAPEPTPGHVRRAAGRASSEPIETWATRVEAAVYGDTAVDETIEQQVRSLEPRREPAAQAGEPPPNAN